jgi:hypothetical protein
MKFSVCAALIGAFVAFGASAQAVTYDWSFTSASVSGGGTLDTNVPVGPAQIVGISGTWGGNAITGLIAPGGFFNDNTLLALTPSTALTFNGFSFDVSGVPVEVFFCMPMDGCLLASYAAEIQDSRRILGTFSISPALMATPIPTALPLFASGLGFLGWAVRRRRQKQIA